MKIHSKQQRLADALKKNLLKRKQQKQKRQTDPLTGHPPLKIHEPEKLSESLEKVT